MITQTYNLNTVPGGIPVRVPVSQYDTGSRNIIFSLYSGSVPFSIPEGAAVTVDGRKPDRKGFSYVAAASGNTVTVTVTEQMTAAPGNAECQLTVMQAGKVLGSANFLLIVERAALPEEADMSETEIGSIETWKNQALAAADSAETSRGQAANSAQAAAESAAAAQASAENAANHTHDAGSIASGTLSTARLPTVPVSKGGLAKTSWTANRLIYPSSSTAFTQLAHPTTAGSFLRQGTSGAPYWTVPENVRSAIGAAPSGSGLGENPAEIANANDAVLPGWYYIKSLSSTNAPLIGQNKTVLLVERAGNVVKQTASYLDDEGGRICTAVRIFTAGSSITSIWYWINPLLHIGTEYATTEFWQNKTVYTKLVDFGSLPQNATKSVAHGADATRVIRAAGTTGTGVTIPYDIEVSIGLGVTLSKIYIKTNYAATTTANVQIWYTKD